MKLSIELSEDDIQRIIAEKYCVNPCDVVIEDRISSYEGFYETPVHKIVARIEKLDYSIDHYMMD